MNQDILEGALKHFLRAKHSEAHRNAEGGYSVSVQWDLPTMSVISMNSPQKFVEIFENFLEPLASLMQISQKQEIERLRTENEKLKATFETYKQAARDLGKDPT